MRAVCDRPLSTLSGRSAMGSGPLSFRDTALDRNTVILAEPRASLHRGGRHERPGVRMHTVTSGRLDFAAAGGHGVACRPFS